MSTPNRDLPDLGLSEVYGPEDPQVDIVLVHGLNGHPYKTWTSKKPEVFWPADLLPKYLEQRCRILTYGYDANVASFTDGGVSNDHVHNHAESLAVRLEANRSLKKAATRPLIFVCHSLGGLVVKRCLIYCSSLADPKLDALRSVFISTYGILFLGTPHNGSDLAKWGSLLQSIASAALPRKFFDSSSKMIDTLKTNNETLQNINLLFAEIMTRFRIFFFHETRPMDLGTTKGLVVDEYSAAPIVQGTQRMGIERDHSTMCKFETESAPGFDVVAAALRSYAEEAPSIVASRWVAEQRIREFERQNLARELLSVDYPQAQIERSASPSPSQSPKSGNNVTVEWSSPQLIEAPPVSPKHSPALSTREPPAVDVPLVAPLHFRPNSIFVGFNIEMARLRQKLTNKEATEVGTASVLLWGPPGCGKSHLAREYVWRYRDDFPSGIFWMDCRSAESLTKCYWDTGQVLGCLESAQAAGSSRLLNWIDRVRKCLESRSSWLIVFDGLTFDDDKAIMDFGRYIPDKRGNSVILTSVDKTLANRQRLLNPPAIKVYPLSKEEGSLFLFKRMGIRRPNELQVEKAEQLVQNYAGLPFGIHAAAYMLIARGRALEKYSPTPSDTRLSTPFLDIVKVLRGRGRKEAITLLYILCFLDHEVPVNLLKLGADALSSIGMDIRSPGRDGSLKPELDNTIATLIRAGLIDRSLRPFSLSSSESKESLEAGRQAASSSEQGELPQTHKPAATVAQNVGIEVLTTHTVIQNVLLEDLRAVSIQGFDNWLTVAIHLLCSSYEEACERIRLQFGRGLARDFREYETHAARLWKRHIPRSKDRATAAERQSRHDLHHLLQRISKDLSNSRPSLEGSPHQLSFSIFERSDSSSEDGQTISISDLTRVSTWSLDALETTESPIDYRQYASHANFVEQPFLDDDAGYLSDSDARPRPERLRSDVTEKPDTLRQALLHAIFEGRPTTTKKRKDLGERKVMPTVSITHAEAGNLETQPSPSPPQQLHRTLSSESQAEAALSAIRKRRTSSSTVREASLGKASNNRPLPAPESATKNDVDDGAGKASLAHLNGKIDVSDGPSSAVWPEGIPVEQISQITRPPLDRSVPTEAKFRLWKRYPKDQSTMPSGYTSQPMSRDTSRESELAAPVGHPLTTARSLSPPRMLSDVESIPHVGTVGLGVRPPAKRRTQSLLNLESSSDSVGQKQTDEPDSPDAE